MAHPPGTIGIYTDHIARFSDFTVAITALEVPEGTIMKWGRGVYLPHNTNEFIENMQGEWLFLMDDDHRFATDTLMRLLDHEQDVVVGLTSKKIPPYDPVIYRHKWGTGDLVPVKLAGLSGLIPIDACGKPGMLIRKHVLDAIDPPWCEYIDGTLGSEDWDFCNKIGEAGFQIYADLNLPIAHMAPLAAYKVQQNGGWGTLLDLGNNQTVFIAE